MSAVADQQSSHGRTTPLHHDHGDSAPRFTAANRSSPMQDRNVLERILPHGRRMEDAGNIITHGEEYSITTEATQVNPNERIPFDLQPRDVIQSPGERKRSSSVEGSPTSSQSRKKRRTSPPGHADSSKLFNNNAASDESPFYAEGPHSAMDQQHNYTTDPQGWQHHHRGASVNSDTQLAEALQRDSQHFVPGQSNAADLSPDQGYSTSSPHPPQSMTNTGIHGQMSPLITAPMLQKQRKRNFSNRTKTGCLTCRERKKKCDETKPTCNNCERGGFFCKGYSQANGVYKTTVSRDQPTLQAKNDYYDPAAASPYVAQRHVPPPQPYGLTMQETRPGDLERTRLLSVEEERTHSRATPQNQEPCPKTVYNRHDWRAAQSGQHPPEPLPRQDYPPAPPMTELPRQHMSFIHPGPPIPLHPPHHRSASQTSQYTDQRITAQLALEHASSRPSLAPSGTMYRAEKEPPTEKEKMLHGVPFRSNDPQLKRDRQDCAQAVHRYNKNVIEPGNLSDNARREQFRKIIEPHIKQSLDTGDVHQNTMSPASSISGKSTNGGALHQNADSSNPFGRLGSNVDVEAPFYCDYGYNIRIGDGVEIGANCRIQDACPVEIGARTVIGPDVKILAVDADFEGALVVPGEKRLLRGRKIVIGDDCYIGAGAIIAPGVILENGAVIAAGMLVQKSPNSVAPGPTNMMNKLPNQHWPPPQY